MKRIILYFLGVVIVLNGLAALLTPANDVPGERSPAPTPTAVAAPDGGDAEPCDRWIAQGFACEFIVFPEMEIRPSPDAIDNALAAVAE